MRFLSVYCLIMVGGLALEACAATGSYSAGPFRGKIVDAETKQPLEGAVVLAIWDKQGPIGGPGGPRSLFYDAQETLTDSNGEFNLPGISGFFPLSKIRGPLIVIFKPGYGSYPRFAPRTDWRERLILGEHITLPLIPARTRQMRLESRVDINPLGIPDENKRELLRLLRIDREELFPTK
jgi:hypothetical protein